RLQYTVNTAEHGKRQDNILVFAAFECITDEIGYAPDKIDFFAKVVHELLFSPFRHCIQQRFFSCPGTAYYCACLLSSEKARCSCAASILLDMTQSKVLEQVFREGEKET